MQSNSYSNCQYLLTFKFQQMVYAVLSFLECLVLIEYNINQQNYKIWYVRNLLYFDINIYLQATV